MCLNKSVSVGYNILKEKIVSKAAARNAEKHQILEQSDSLKMAKVRWTSEEESRKQMHFWGDSFAQIALAWIKIRHTVTFSSRDREPDQVVHCEWPCIGLLLASHAQIPGRSQQHRIINVPIQHIKIWIYNFWTAAVGLSNKHHHAWKWKYSTGNKQGTRPKYGKYGILFKLPKYGKYTNTPYCWWMALDAKFMKSFVASFSRFLKAESIYS